MICSPTKFICSSAERTRETVEIDAASSGQRDPDWSIGGVACTWQRLTRLCLPFVLVFQSAETLMVVAHNPGIIYLASMLAGKGY